MGFLDAAAFGITVKQYILAGVVLFIAIFLERLIKGFVGRRFVKWLKGKEIELPAEFDVRLARPIRYTVWFLGIVIAIAILNPPQVEPAYRRLFVAAYQSIFIILISWAVVRLVDLLRLTMAKYAAKTPSKLDDQLIPLVARTLKVLIIIVAASLVLQTLGYSVTGLLTGLGLGGAALAFAAKDTLSNFFGAVQIFVDRPFMVGDWIEAGDLEGVVEDINLRSTRIRTFAKTLISVPNNVLANMAINNWSAMPIRRVKQIIGVTYSTTSEQMRKAVEGIRKILAEHPGVDQSFYLVYFRDFGASSLDIFVYYFTKSTVWAEYLDVRQDVNLKIMEYLESIGVEIAFPSQSVYVHSLPSIHIEKSS